MSAVNWLGPSSEREDWWQAHVSLCMLTFMFAILFTLYPTKMSSFKELNDKRDSDVDSGMWYLLHVRLCCAESGSHACYHSWQKQEDVVAYQHKLRREYI